MSGKPLLSSRPPMLWLALHLPRLPLEVFATRRAGSVVVAQDRVVVADDAAERAGIAAGMRLSSAWGLMPELSVHARDLAAEQDALVGLGCWAGSISPQVSLVPPDMLLLEVGGCLRLFGGVARLRETTQAGCGELGFSASAAIAPVPLAAEWLARTAAGVDCTDPGMLASVLGRIGLQALYPADRCGKLFAAWGMRTLGDLLRQPRAGLARRLGPEFTLRLARALGEEPDPRPFFVFPAYFDQGLELPVPVEQAQALLFAARRLIASLVGWLAARVSGMRECRLFLKHRSGPETAIDLRFAEPVCQAGRIGQVLRERLERHTLVSPVEAMRLRVERIEQLPASSAALFGAGQATASVPEVVERLRARLGADAVHGLQTLADHRPEAASRRVPEGRPDAPAPRASRPFWLLPQPLSLREEGGRPIGREGALKLLGSAERIESGWWDAGEEGAVGEVRRDYFVALAPSGQLFWIYRDAAGWWQHGLFG